MAIPSLGTVGGLPASKPLERMREALQVLLGLRGDPLDAALTLRSAIDRGLIDRIGNALTGSVTYVNTFPTTTVGGGGVDPTPDLTPPPDVAGLQVLAGFSMVIVKITAPTYTQGHKNLRTNIYAVKRTPGVGALPTFSGSTPKVAEMPGALDIISIPSELNTEWHVWAKHETVDGVLSINAAGGVNGYSDGGAYPTTGQDISALLGLLTGQITRSQLYNDIGAPIDLIMAPSSTAGSVNARIKTESDARLAAISQEVSDRNTAITSGVETAKSYTETYAYKKGDGDSLAGSFTSLATAYNDPSTGLAATRATLLSSYATISGPTNSLASLSTSLQAYADGAGSSAYASAQNYTQNYAYSKTNGDALATNVGTLSAVAKAASLSLPFEAWVINGHSIVTLTDGKVGNKALRLYGVVGAYPNQGNYISIDRTKKYRVRFWARPSSDSDGVLYFSLRQFTNATGTPGPDNGGRSPYKPAVNRTSHNAQFGTDQWGEYSNIWSSSDWQSGVLYVQPEFLDNYSGAIGWWDIQDFSITEVTEIDSISATITEVSNAQTSMQGDIGSLAGRATALESSVNTPSAIPGSSYNATYAALQSEISTRAGITDSHSSSIQTLQAKVDSPSGSAGPNYNPTYAALQAEQNARAALDGSVSALWTLRAEVSSGGRTLVGGWGLSATATATAGPRIDFGVRADQFYVAAPAGSGVADSFPFVIRTTATTENGVSIPAGVYMNAAYIVNLSAMWARFGTLIADSIATSSISASNLTLGDGTIGGNLKSTVFTSGSAGWILRPNGTAEFGATSIRGQLLAGQIDSRGLNIYAADGSLILSAGSTLNSQVSATAIGAVKTDLTNAPSTILNSNVTATSIGAVKTDLTNAPSTILNSNVTISADGVLSNAGGGQVTTLPVVDAARETNQPPSYYAVGTIREFKHAAAIGLSDADGYWCTLETIKQYAHSQGRYPGYQYAYQQAKTWRRRSVDDTGASWTAWTQDLDRTAYTGALDATNGATWGSNLSNVPTNLAGLTGTEPIKNSLISISANGSLVGGGGGQVTLTGLGFSGDADATYGASWGSTLSGIPTAINDGRVATAIDANGILVSKVKPGLQALPSASGLYMGADYMGYYYAGVGWKTYMDNVGRFYLGGASGALQWDGSNLLINGGGVFSGALSAASGTFTGALSAASGTFSGSLTATAINAVDTLNIKGNAVTIPVSSFTAASTFVGGAEQTVQTITFTSSGSPIFLVFSLAASLFGTTTGELYTYLRRNGSTIISGMTSGGITDTPGAGSVTYTLVCATSGGANYIVSNRSLFGIEVKR